VVARQETEMCARGLVLLSAGATFLVIKSGRGADYLSILAGDNRGAKLLRPDCLLVIIRTDERHSAVSLFVCRTYRIRPVEIQAVALMTP
jgi:hypothetical protein